MQIQCPNCNNICEADAEPEIGQNIVCPFCSEKFSYSGSDEFPEDGDISATDEQDTMLDSGLKIVGTFPSNGIGSAAQGYKKFTPVDSRILNRMTNVFNGSATDGWVRAHLFNIWWWFGNVFWTVLFVYGLIRLADLDDAMSMLRGSGGINGLYYIFLIFVWAFAIGTHWVIYKIAVGVYETRAMMRNQQGGNK